MSYLLLASWPLVATESYTLGLSLFVCKLIKWYARWNIFKTLDFRFQSLSLSNHASLVNDGVKGCLFVFLSDCCVRSTDVWVAAELVRRVGSLKWMTGAGSRLAACFFLQSKTEWNDLMMCYKLSLHAPTEDYSNSITKRQTIIAQL